MVKPSRAIWRPWIFHADRYSDRSIEECVISRDTSIAQRSRDRVRDTRGRKSSFTSLLFHSELYPSVAWYGSNKPWCPLNHHNHFPYQWSSSTAFGSLLYLDSSLEKLSSTFQVKTSWNGISVIIDLLFLFHPLYHITSGRNCNSLLF